MRLLLDTHVLLWSFYRPERLSRSAQELIQDTDNAVLFSAASMWEIAIKAALRRDDFQIEPDRILELMDAAGFIEIPVTSRVAVAVRDLPQHHGDPFDRLLVAQAIAEPAILLTADRKLQAYSDLVRLI
ncbi:type II toxin-antitoxin system VapC family toxin [Bosea sp. 124]|uniref:type II toxin-antitoxin system VapC family toxin n=1 Tax=Bosea sp. 124 TaxID=2135642 RepID=UPI000D344974|nr:type II toxin-antitoxin system VapC family toxin [Bosea sp. 124]PTM42016.1 PIN domain nuclease of toxin-antitoxin system [Bosea sp. 124]